MRSARKLLRYAHRIHLDMKRSRRTSAILHPIEQLCVSLLVFSYPCEYLLSVMIVLDTYPVVRQSNYLRVPMVPGKDFATIDFSYAYLILLAMSLPCFVVSFVQVWRKREKVIYERPQRSRKVRIKAAKTSDEDSQ